MNQRDRISAETEVPIGIGVQRSKGQEGVFYRIMLMSRHPEDVHRRMSSHDGHRHSYLDVHICVWEGKQCEEWATYVCRKRGVDTHEVDLRGFRITDGISLQQLSRQEFCSIVGDQYGTMFWKELRSFRAQQKQRCSNCAKYDELPALIPWPDNHSAQQSATDLSSHSHVTKRSLQKSSPSPSPHYFNSTPCGDQVSPFPYEARSRYPEEHSPPRSYEGSPSPGYQERLRYQEECPPYAATLPPSPESFGSRSRSPHLAYPDQVYWRENEPVLPYQKPLPELLPLEDVDEEAPPPTHHRANLANCWQERDVYRHGPDVSTNKQPVPVVCSPNHAYPTHSSHANYVSHPIRRNEMLDCQSRSHFTPIIQYAHPSQQSHPAHNNMHHQPLAHANYRANYTYVNHSSNSSVKTYVSDEDDEGQSESGRLIIDLEDSMSEGVEKDSEDSTRQTQENCSFPHLKKIPTKRRRDRGPKSWEFLMRLLACSETNPSIIRWEDEAEGSFRLVQPQEIANMWGTRSKKEDLSYNNFARALRYHYKTKLLYKISERQLVYGCGPVALEFYRQLVLENGKSTVSSGTG
ncbi:hypothetical protein SK128_020428 [Halocaridina rubra]|uniref:ETS domain-containing protein n=1 Tax=Halocaridina rubra TaxID=373956 RepID=A0AAN8WUT7_HALRR